MLISYGHVLEKHVFSPLLLDKTKHTFLLKQQRTKALRHLIPVLIFKKLLWPIDSVLNLWPRTLLLMHNLNKTILGFTYRLFT